MRPRAGGGTALQRLLLACCLSAAAPVGLLAQGSDNVRTYWVPTHQFKIPFQNINPDPRIAAVLLHVSENGQDYRLSGTAAPSQREFLFRANHDGKYSFIVQTRDQNGILVPSDLRGVPPNLRICVDTQKPVIHLEATKQPDWPAAIRWEVEDENFDDVHAEYRSANGGEWYPLPLPREPRKDFGWKPAVNGRLEVRLQARDKAGNMAEPRVVTVDSDPRLANAPPPAAGNGGGEAIEVKYVPSRKFQLAYQVDEQSKGPSGVKSVCVWKMREGGPWQKYREVDAQKGSSVEVTVELAGRWGFRLIPRSGVGLAEPDPRPGDRPDLWVEVDEQKPQVIINNLHVSRGTDASNLTVSWKASDKFLRARPITISYGSEPSKWVEVARDLPNTGSYTFPSPEGLYQLYIKVTAIDEAENVGEAVSKEPVKVDLKVPRIKQIKILQPNGSDVQSPNPPQPSGSDLQSRNPPPSPAPSQAGMLMPGSQQPPPQSTPTGFPPTGGEWDRARGKQP